MIADLLVRGVFLWIIAAFIYWVFAKGGAALLGIVLVPAFLIFLVFGGWMYVVQWVLDFFGFIFG